MPGLSEQDYDFTPSPRSLARLRKAAKAATVAGAAHAHDSKMTLGPGFSVVGQYLLAHLAFTSLGFARLNLARSFEEKLDLLVCLFTRKNGLQISKEKKINRNKYSASHSTTSQLKTKQKFKTVFIREIERVSFLSNFVSLTFPL